MLKRLKEMDLSVVSPDGAFYCFINIKSFNISSEDFALGLLKKKKVAVVPGSVFGVGGEGYIRCCYAASIEIIKESLNRLNEYIIKLKEK